MLIWENWDGTFEPAPLVTSRSDTARSNADATLDNRKDQGTGSGERTESKGSTPTSYTGAFATSDSDFRHGWREHGHSQR